jgi:myo-inositol 2-dehydrogenase/D-chiro-inositol 1-dehydrogenase
MYKVGLFGYGRAGKIHDRGIAEMTEFEVAEIYDTKFDHNENLDKILENIDVAVICTPTDTHYEFVTLCLKHGIHVFCEKPLCFEIEQIKDCYRLARENDVKLLIGMNRRFDPKLNDIKNKIDIVQPFSISTISRDWPYPSESFLGKSGGIVKDCAIHDIDLINWLSGSFPVRVYAIGNENKDVIIDDMIIALEYPNITASIHVSRISDSYDQRVEVYGKHETLVSENPKQKPISFAERYEYSYKNELLHFYDMIHNNADCIVTEEEMIQLTHTIDCIEESVASRVSITL